MWKNYLISHAPNLFNLNTCTIDITRYNQSINYDLFLHAMCLSCSSVPPYICICLKIFATQSGDREPGSCKRDSFGFLIADIAPLCMYVLYIHGRLIMDEHSARRQAGNPRGRVMERPYVSTR
jgi:hypothetical protein